jgi:hypothetical protein
VTIFYHRPDGDYADTVIVVNGQSYACVPTALGCSATIQAVANSTISFTVCATAFRTRRGRSPR